MSESFCPFVVPPFDPGKHSPKIKYVWWSWHPNYPYWSMSCWDGETEEKAWEVRLSHRAGCLDVYHNKLIREGDGSFTEVADDPCIRMDVWDRISLQKRPEHDAIRQAP